MKKVWIFLMCLLLITGAALTALAANETTLTVTADQTTVNRGDILTVTVSVSGSDPFTSLGYIFYTESAYFTVTEGRLLAALDLPGEPSIKRFDENGLAVGGWVEDTASTTPIAVTLNGAILEMTVKIKEDAPLGDFTITDAVSVKNDKMEKSFSLREDTITVVCDHAYEVGNTQDDTLHALTCSLCGDEKTEAHKWNAGVVMQEPTLSQTGEKLFTCNICGRTKTETLPKLPAGDTKFTLTPNKTEAVRGETITVMVAMSGADPFTSLGYQPLQDSEYFTVISGDLQQGIEQAGALMQTFDQYGLAAAFPKEVTLNCDILLLTLQIKEDAPFGTFPFTYTAAVKNGKTQVEYGIAETSVTVVCDHRNAEYTYQTEETHKMVCQDCGAERLENHNFTGGTCTGCGFQNSSALPDFNDDGILTDADAIQLLRYTLFPDIYPISADGDVNSDGEVNDADAIYLLRHILFPDVFPLYAKKES